MSKPMKSKIGGQALIEGIMMRGLDQVSMAVRKPDGSIHQERWQASDLVHPKWYRRFPLVRGSVNMVESLIVGYKCLMKSAELSGGEEQLSPFEQKLIKKFGGKFYHFIGVLTSVLGVALALILFLYLPMLAVKGLSLLVPLGGFQTLIEGVIKIAIFVGYLALVGRMKEIRTTFSYHGAEHKTIACYEAGDPLTVENVRKDPRFHPRCGTSFLLSVLIISILVFSVVTWDNLWIRIGLKLLLLPVVVGISYELIKLAGRYDNCFTRILSAPGLWLQRLTTREPDDGQIEVAITALSDVIPEDKSIDQW